MSLHQNFRLCTSDETRPITSAASPSKPIKSETATAVMMYMNQIIVKKKKCAVRGKKGLQVNSPLYDLAEEVGRVGRYIPIALDNNIVIFENDSGTSITQVSTAHARDLQRNGTKMKLLQKPMENNHRARGTEDEAVANPGYENTRHS